MSNEETPNTPAVDMNALAEKVMADMAAVKAELKDFKGSIGDAIRNIPDVVHAVERVAADLKLAGEQKKELAVSILNKMIDIPLAPEAVEAVLIGFAVDAVVAAFNKYGKSWVSKIGL